MRLNDGVYKQTLIWFDPMASSNAKYVIWKRFFENVDMGSNVGIMIISGGTKWRCIDTKIEIQYRDFNWERFVCIKDILVKKTSVGVSSDKWEWVKGGESNKSWWST
mgnify:CR=1 FL=1